MITIVEPKDHIARLWGKQQIRESDTYRLMRYVIRADHDGKVLLHNVVTGQLVILTQEEEETLDSLPKRYDPYLKPLIQHYYLVPEQYDEHSIVSGMRDVFRKMADTKERSALTFFTILPTTSCNARCYYCFEKGIEFATMTQETAKDVIRFITTHCNGKKVWLKWFGGEPTVAANRITQICTGLKQNGVTFSSIMTTNGYLFSEEMAHEARYVWNLDRVTLSMDGTGENYNRIKDYVGACDNPYERVLHNVGLLTEQGIHVLVRMNFDQTNYRDFVNLLSDIHERYHSSTLIEVRAHYINDVQIVDGIPRYHGSKEWYNETILELHQLSQSAGFLHKNHHLPCLSHRWCPASSLKSVTIKPDGKLVSCYELLGDDEVKGNLKEGITNQEIVTSWLRYADESDCIECNLFPNCGKIFKCPRKHGCYQKAERLFDTKELMVNSYNDYAHKNNKEGV